MSEHLILAIDDDESEVRPTIPDEGFYLETIDPNDGEISGKLSSLVDSASLILLDQKFNIEPKPLSLQAPDGASFVAHLRSWSRINGEALAPVVLFTNLDEAFKNEVPAVGASVPLNGTFVNREFRLAPALDVEWVQHKGEENTKERIAELARASVQLKEIGGDDGMSLKDIEAALELEEDVVWADRAREELRNARPPVTQVEEDGSTHFGGPSQVIRWMCHRALPYPGLFLSDLYTAWALGLTIEDFTAITNLTPDTTPWLSDLWSAEYCGPLNEFLGRRWWRAGVDHVVWTLDQESSKQKDRLAALTILAPGVKFGEMRSPSTHVVTWTPDFIEDKIESIDQAVQLRVPGWPAEALDPWIAKADIQNDEVLKAMIESADLP
jgi:hypothetical protein